MIVIFVNIPLSQNPTRYWWLHLRYKDQLLWWRQKLYQLILSRVRSSATDSCHTVWQHGWLVVWIADRTSVPVEWIADRTSVTAQGIRKDHNTSDWADTQAFLASWVSTVIPACSRLQWQTLGQSDQNPSPMAADLIPTHWVIPCCKHWTWLGAMIPCTSMQPLCIWNIMDQVQLMQSISLVTIKRAPLHANHSWAGPCELSWSLWLALLLYAAMPLIAASWTYMDYKWIVCYPLEDMLSEALDLTRDLISWCSLGLHHSCSWF